MQYGGNKLDFLRHTLAQVFHFLIPPTRHFQAFKPLFGFAFGFAGC